MRVLPPAQTYVSFNIVPKNIQFTLGGFEELQAMKVRTREGLDLPPLPEDSIRVVRAMRAASPPASAMELIEQQQQQKRGRRSRRVWPPPPRPDHRSIRHVTACASCLFLLVLSGTKGNVTPEPY